jgi:pimeloyl-ACP methyl ester carboxylesterase
MGGPPAGRHPRVGRYRRTVTFVADGWSPVGPTGPTTESGLQIGSSYGPPAVSVGGPPFPCFVCVRVARDTVNVDARLESWASRGRHLDVGGRRVFVWEQGEGPPLLALHGFPSSSYDWRRVADLLPERRFVAVDLPGFGLSDKSADADYSLMAQSDVVEQVVGALGIASCDLVAHDMGDSVAAELLARAGEGTLGFTVDRAVLLNGSIFIEMAQLTSGQKLFLALPPRKLALSPPVRVFRRQIRRLFSPDHQPSREEIEMMELLLSHEGGARLVPITIRYIEERRQMAERWTSGLVDFKGDVSLIWGDLDPVAVPAIATRLLELRPATVAVRWSDVGHWPQLEVPERVAAELMRLLP